jgi:ectoine hydroxylase-related dioxygenase (phytanoyl-CoA dioxygenase family)
MASKRDSAVGQFRRDGYAVVHDVVDTSALAETRQFLESRIAREIDLACKEIGCSDPADFVAHIGRQAESSGAGLSKGTRDALSGHFSLETRLSQELWRIPRDAGLRTFLEELFGSRQLFMHMPPTARFVLPGNVYAGVPARQDVSYNHHMTDFVTVWVPMVDIDSECGGVTVFKGSNATKERLAGAETDKFWLKSLPTGAYEAEHCTMRLGDVLVLSKWILHESMPNRSGRTRISSDCRFFPATERSKKHVLDMQRWEVIEPGVPA